jgi:chitinase
VPVRCFAWYGFISGENDMRIETESALLKYIEYDAETRVLTVEFNKGGRYSYADFPPTEWANFDKADSKGRFFLAHVKGQYAHTKLPEEKTDDGKKAE